MTSPGTLGTWPVTIGGVTVTTILDPAKPDTRQRAGVQGQYQAQEATNRLVPRTVPIAINTFSKGSGYVRRRGADDDGGYAWTENMIMWFGEGPIPAGRILPYSITSPSSDNGQGNTPIANSKIVQFIEAFGHLWLIFDAPALLRIPNCDPAQTPVYDPPINNATYGTASTALGAGNAGRCAEVFETSGGAAALYVGTDNAGTGRVYEITTPGTVTAGSTDFTTGSTYSASKMRSVWWADKETNTGAQRLLLKTGPNEVRHCIAGSDPKLQASYVTPIKVGAVSEEIQALVASELHAYAITNGGIKDFNELRVRNLTPYWRQTQSLIRQSASVLRGLPAMLMNDHLVAGRGFGSIDRYPVSQDGYQQRVVGECSPMAYAQDGTPIQGWFTAFCDSGDGGLLAALYNPDKQTTYIGRAYPRELVNVPGRGPLVWHWAEVVIPPISGTPYMVSAMHVAAPALSVGGVLASPKLYLWLALTPSAGSQALLRYVELPVGTGPLSIRASGGTSLAHASPSGSVAQNCRLYLTGQQWDSDTALKPLLRQDLGHQGVTSTATIAAYARVDGDPATLTTDNTWTLQGTANATAPDDATSTAITPASPLAGKIVYTRYDFTTPSPFTAPPRLQGVRLRAAVRYELFDTRTLYVLLSRDYELHGGVPSLDDPDAAFASVVAFQTQAPVTYVDETATSYQALVEQGIAYTREWISETVGHRTVAKVVLSLVRTT